MKTLALLLCLIFIIIGCDNKQFPSKSANAFRKVMSESWWEIVQLPDFQLLNSNDREEIKMAFWKERVIKNPDFQKLSSVEKIAIENQFFKPIPLLIPIVVYQPQEPFFNPMIDEYMPQRQLDNMIDINNNLSRLLEEQERHNQELESSISNFEWQQKHELWKERLRRGW